MARINRWAVLFLMAGTVSLASLPVVEGPGDKGETKEYLALKGRMGSPKPADMDAKVSVASFLAQKGEKEWSMAKGGALEGYVIQVEKEEDGDFHLVLSANANETSTAKWVIIEVSPAWRKKNPALSDAKLRALRGKKIHATGWLLYEPDGQDEGNDPRGTRWELHPVTDIKVMDH